MKLKPYSNGEITVTFDQNICTHSANCVKGLPSVFDIKKKPWISIDGASTEEIKVQIAKCPSGALKWTVDEK